MRTGLYLLSPCLGTGLLISLKQLMSAVHRGADGSMRYPTETEKIALKKKYKTLEVEKNQEGLPSPLMA